MERGALILLVLAGVFSAMLGGSLNVPKGESGADPERPVRIVAGESQASASVASLSGNAVELERNFDGHFYADVEINGTAVRALVDTGATGIALSREDARSAGLAVSIGMPGVVGRGADGDVRGEYVTLDRVTLGHRTAEGMDAVVLNAGEQTLLGQAFLSRFESVEIKGDRMVLR